MELLAIIGLLAPIARGAVCAAVVLTFVSIADSRGTLSAPLLVVLAAGLLGLLVTEFEIVRILLGWGFEGRCSANTSIAEKVPRFRPCTISEWRSEQLFPRFFGGIVWYWRGTAAVAYCAVFFALLHRWRKRVTGNL